MPWSRETKIHKDTFSVVCECVCPWVWVWPLPLVCWSEHTRSCDGQRQLTENKEEKNKKKIPWLGLWGCEGPEGQGQILEQHNLPLCAHSEISSGGWRQEPLGTVPWTQSYAQSRLPPSGAVCLRPQLLPLREPKDAQWALLCELVPPSSLYHCLMSLRK